MIWVKISPVHSSKTKALAGEIPDFDDSALMTVIKRFKVGSRNLDSYSERRHARTAFLEGRSA